MLVVLVFGSMGPMQADAITDLEAAAVVVLLAPACLLFLWLHPAHYGVLDFGLFLLNSVLWGLCAAGMATVSRRLLARRRRASQAGDPSVPPCLGG